MASTTSRGLVKVMLILNCEKVALLTQRWLQKELDFEAKDAGEENQEIKEGKQGNIIRKLGCLPYCRNQNFYFQYSLMKLSRISF